MADIIGDERYIFTGDKVTKLPPITPIRFPSSSGSSKVAHKIKGTQGRPTREVIAEMKRLSKKDIYPSPNNHPLFLSRTMSIDNLSNY
jgi:hypothetical protein